ncbi:glycosyltransferase family 2 protein [Anditalea andensis]|uniref:Family 2 glycosyl transferase n=1 Tax=Anditalea andensis TaxID=1048983 RepID=A0A074KV75_9BACT|nr:glycosyltransferase family 2 protein [Anditalea andensis]KEO72829.1 family 2 glycosyl transferase [Anditalea andensis]
MAEILVITPVKDALEYTLQTAKAIKASSIALDHQIFNDFSSDDTTYSLEENKGRIGYNLINLEDLTDTPSPNYKLVLQLAQKRALDKKVPLIIVESDVEVGPDTLEKMYRFHKAHPKAGLVGAITVDQEGKVNFPYLKFSDVKDKQISTSRSLSFCCTLFSVDFLKSFDFVDLDDSKDWYDTTISQTALRLGFQNYVLMDVPVLHRPHGSRPWKMLKYSQPIKYYWKKFWNSKDKI